MLPIRVLVSEPDAGSRRLICSPLEFDPGITVACVDNSKLLSSILENAPDLVIVDIHTPAISEARSWEALEINPSPTTIITGYDFSAVSLFATHAIDYLVKPFDADRPLSISQNRQLLAFEWGLPAKQQPWSTRKGNRASVSLQELQWKRRKRSC